MNEHALAYVALGSNLTLTPEEIYGLPEALAEYINLDQEIMRIGAVSGFYRTPAFPDRNDPDFINAAFAIETCWKPRELLIGLHAFEARMGRERPYRWSPRVLDLDLLFYEDRVWPSERTWQYWANLTPEKARAKPPEELILPHPRAHERGFVLRPMLDIAPDLVHPVLNKTVQQLWDELDEQARAGIRPL